MHGEPVLHSTPAAARVTQSRASARREQVPPRAARVLAREAQAVHDAGEEVAVRDEAARGAARGAARHAAGFFNVCL